MFVEGVYPVPAYPQKERDPHTAGPTFVRYPAYTKLCLLVIFCFGKQVFVVKTSIYKKGYRLIRTIKTEKKN